MPSSMTAVEQATVPMLCQDPQDTQERFEVIDRPYIDERGYRWAAVVLECRMWAFLFKRGSSKFGFLSKR